MPHPVELQGEMDKDHGRHRLSVEILRGGVEIIDTLETEWLALCEQGFCDRWFQRPEFSRAYLRNFAAGTEAVVCTVRDPDGRLVAILPLYREKKWVIPGLFAIWKLRGLSMVDGFPCDLIVASKDLEENAGKALWSALDRLPGWSILEIPNVPEGGSAENLTREAGLSQAAAYSWDYMHTPNLTLGDWSGEHPFRLARSKNLRHTLKRIENTEGKNGIRLRRIESAADAFSQFFELEKRSWKGKARRTVAGCEKLRKFYVEIAEAAERYGYLSFYFLDIGGVPVASRFALTCHGRYIELECIHDEAYNEHAPGHMLIAKILSDCARRGLRDVEFTGHTSEYKERWTRVLKPHNYWFIYRRGLLGRLLYIAKTKLMPVIGRIALSARKVFGVREDLHGKAA
jgi:CelD/BcsL family acetyltransferase involved in cellulose biosynthesis